MKFRLKAFGLHLLGSACLMAVLLGALYAGWYRWPGWYLAGALTIALIMTGIDVVLGPLLTLLIANPNKPRRELARDVGIIIFVQLIAAGYGVRTLWHGRPLYYTYSERFLEMTQADELDPGQVELGRKVNPQLAPLWYSRPRWVYAPLPNGASGQKIMAEAITGGRDVIQMPRYYQPWQNGLPDLKAHLRKVIEMTEIGLADKQVVGRRMQALGFSPEQPNALPMLGRGKPLVGVFDPRTGEMKALLRVD